MSKRPKLEDLVRRTPLPERLAESRRRIARMCAERRCPRMSIPPEWDDDDIYICQTLEDAIAALGGAERAGDSQREDS